VALAINSPDLGFIRDEEAVFPAHQSLGMIESFSERLDPAGPIDDGDPAIAILVGFTDL
jgi:hypothetical protein